MTYTLAMTSNYAESTGDPEQHLERIAAAGYTHVLWAHHAWADYIYTEPEMDHAADCLRRTGLSVNDLHCPTGRDQKWGSEVEYQRLAGVELLKNRIHMAARLSCDVIVCHIPTEPAEGPGRAAYWDRQRRTLDVVCPVAEKHRVRIALENTLPGNFDTLERYLALYGPEVLGLCYDSGHGNARVDWPGNGLERFEKIADRVIDLHLHDNDGSDDQHLPPFTGTTDWPRLAAIVAGSAYRKTVVPLEVGMSQAGTDDAEGFLASMADVGHRLAELFAAAAESR